MGMTEGRVAGRKSLTERKKGRKGQKTVLGPREKRRITQLVVCLALFLAVFIGKGIFPEKLAEIRTELLSLLRSDTDFQAAFSRMGDSISQGEPVLATLEGLWVDVLGEGEQTPAEVQGVLDSVQVRFLSGFGQKEGQMLVNRLPEGETLPLAATPAPQPTKDQTEESPQPSAEPVAYTGPALPDNTSMDKYQLHLENTVTPVMGVLTSQFGWREHPIDGEDKFHNGVDLAVDTGTQVLAFADGTVDYIGDSPEEYGLYLQISHANGVKSFYAHCSQLLVRQGQTVKAGEPVALSGNTGKSTGPHLHLELKVDGVRINPIYYITTN